MTTKILTGTYSAGYTLAYPITTLSIAASGYVEGNGVATASSATNSYAVVNRGRIAATDSKGTHGVYLGAGGAVTNGAAGDTSALIDGYSGVWIASGPGVVRNFGTIAALSASSSVFLGEGGSVTNGAASDTTALIEGGAGNTVWVSGVGVVTNFGTISSGEFAITLFTGGKVVNGSDRDTGALIEAQNSGVFADNPAVTATVVNFGSISGDVAVLLGDGGSVTNGDGADVTATINGGLGLLLDAPATIRNFGTIQGLGTPLNSGEIGVQWAGGTLTNGSRADTQALIEGGEGIGRANAGPPITNTVINYGTIEGLGVQGQSPVAINFSGSVDDLLVVEAGSAFIGAVMGYGGTLELASGTGKLTGLLAGGDVTVSGSMAPTTFTDFDTVMIGSGAVFKSPGLVTVAAGQTVTSSGSLDLGVSKGSVANAGLIETAGAGVLTIAGTVANTGTLSVGGGTMTLDGSVTGAGVATIDGGTLDLASSFTEDVAFSGKTGALALAQSQDYTGTVTGFSKSGGTSLDLADVGFASSTEATFSGTRTGGVLTITDGTNAAHINLAGNYTKSTFIASSDGHGGTIVVEFASQRGAFDAPFHRGDGRPGRAGRRRGPTERGAGAPRANAR